MSWRAGQTRACERRLIETTRLKAPSEAAEMGRYARRFEKIFAAAEKISYNSLAKEMIIYRYGRKFYLCYDDVDELNR